MLIELKYIERTLLLFSSLHDPDTEQHSIRTTALCMKMATRLQFGDDEKNFLRIAALLHDIGKVGVDRHVLNKAGAFTEGEWAMVRKHPIFGYELAHALNLNAEICGAIRGHHENYDGSGYPDQLKSEAIPYFARLIRIADTFDALMSNRPDRNSIPLRDAIEVLRKYEHNFDPILLREFVTMVSEPQ